MNKENARLKELKEISILDTLPEKEYDDITLLASTICQVPIALISLIDSDRQWFKSKVGIDVNETPREYAFCAHAILKPNEVMEVKNANEDERFADNPLVVEEPKIVFYTGVPLVTENGNALGTLCVIDRVEKKLSTEQIKALQALARQVMRLFEVRKNQIKLENARKSLTQRINDLEKFAHIAAHDLKSPLANITMLAHMLESDYSSSLDDQAKELIKMMRGTSDTLRGMIEGILSTAKADRIEPSNSSMIEFSELITELQTLLGINYSQYVKYTPSLHLVHTDKDVLLQVLLNLVSNGIKYNHTDVPSVQIEFHVQQDNELFVVSDNGSGINEKDQERIFELFETGDQTDRFGNKGTGIGLATVKRLIEKVGGTLKLHSQINKGTTFYITIPR